MDWEYSGRLQQLSLEGFGSWHFSSGKKALNDFAEGRICEIQGKAYDTADGLRPAETMQAGKGTASKGPDGRIWFSTVAGVFVVDPTRSPKEDPILNVLLV